MKQYRSYLDANDSPDRLHEPIPCRWVIQGEGELLRRYDGECHQRKDHQMIAVPQLYNPKENPNEKRTWTVSTLSASKSQMHQLMVRAEKRQANLMPREEANLER